MPLAPAVFYNEADLGNAVEGRREAGIPEACISVAPAADPGAFAVMVDERAGVEADRVASIVELFGGRLQVEAAISQISAEAR